MQKKEGSCVCTSSFLKILYNLLDILCLQLVDIIVQICVKQEISIVGHHTTTNSKLRMILQHPEISLIYVVGLQSKLSFLLGVVSRKLLLGIPRIILPLKIPLSSSDAYHCSISFLL